jgi:hypothetical protein
MSIYMPHDKQPLFDPYIHRNEPGSNIKLHETHCLNELLPEESCQLISYNQRN